MDALRRVDSILLLGGTSHIGLASVEQFVREGAGRVVLAGRREADLEEARKRVRAAGAEDVRTMTFDADRLDTHVDAIDEAFSASKDIDLVLLVFGVLGPPADDSTREDALALVRVNFEAAVSVGILVLEKLKAQGHGHFVVLSSVAANRPRRENYVYGATKAGMDAFFAGASDSAAAGGVHVMVVRPGRVRTKMTAGMREVPFTVDAETVARSIVAGVRRRSRTVYVPAALGPVMWAMRLLPESVYRRVAG